MYNKIFCETPVPKPIDAAFFVNLAIPVFYPPSLLITLHFIQNQGLYCLEIYKA
jgi:hypothetical protein